MMFVPRCRNVAPSQAARNRLRLNDPSISAMAPAVQTGTDEAVRLKGRQTSYQADRRRHAFSNGLRRSSSRRAAAAMESRPTALADSGLAATAIASAAGSAGLATATEPYSAA